MYADDTTLYCNLEDFVDCDTETAINRELQKINLWLLRNKLTLNVDKTKFMIFHKRKKVPNLSIALNNIAITKVDTFNYLGILLDSNLSWKSHTDMLVLKISTLIGVLHRVKKYFPKSILLTIYNYVTLLFYRYALTTCIFCLSATLLPCALGVIGLDTGTEYKLNYLTSCLCSEESHSVYYVHCCQLYLSVYLILWYYYLSIMQCTLQYIYIYILFFLFFCTMYIPYFLFFLFMTCI